MRSPAHGASDTRPRIVEAARHLFWEKGYAATGLAEMLDRAGANSGSFHHFFDSKGAVRTVLDTYVALLEPHVVQPAWAATTDPIGRIFALLARYRQRLVETDCRCGCPIGRLALEIDAESTPAHELIARNFAAWKRAVEACLRAAGIRQPADLATFVLAIMEGGLMQARAYRTVEPFDDCVRQLRAHLDALARASYPRPAAPRRKKRH